MQAEPQPARPRAVSSSHAPAPPPASRDEMGRPRRAPAHPGRLGRQRSRVRRLAWFVGDVGGDGLRAGQRRPCASAVVHACAAGLDRRVEAVVDALAARLAAGPGAAHRAMGDVGAVGAALDARDGGPARDGECLAPGCESPPRPRRVDLCRVRVRPQRLGRSGPLPGMRAATTGGRSMFTPSVRRGRTAGCVRPNPLRLSTRMGRAGLEPATPAFSMRCSTN